jgi:hypothetical protein
MPGGAPVAVGACARNHPGTRFLTVGLSRRVVPQTSIAIRSLLAQPVKRARELSPGSLELFSHRVFSDPCFPCKAAFAFLLSFVAFDHGASAYH